MFALGKYTGKSAGKYTNNTFNTVTFTMIIDVLTFISQDLVTFQTSSFKFKMLIQNVKI